MNFTQEDYDAVYAKLASNENGICDAIPTNPTEDNGQPATAADIATSIVAVTIIE